MLPVAAVRRSASISPEPAMFILTVPVVPAAFMSPDPATEKLADCVLIAPIVKLPEPEAEAAKSSPSTRSTDRRSEEHTSELQTLMRNSYAVFCLLKKLENNANRRTQDRE